jgi:O-antigen/teichoic acid export membrane protein
MKNLYCICLRSVTLISKFILIIFLSRYITPGELGIYGLMTASIAWAVYIVGYDFYSVNMREILATAYDERVYLIRDQFVFYGFVYCIIFPLLLLIFFTHILSWKYMPWFYSILVLEHLAQEGDRLLITFSRQLEANIVLFLRGGLWVYVVIAVSQLVTHHMSLAFVFSGWMIGVFSAVFLVVIMFRKLNWRKVLHKKVDWYRLRKNAQRATVLFIATMSIQAIMYLGRFFLKFYTNYETVGVYSYFSSLLNVIPVFAYTGIFAFMMPKLVQDYNDKKFLEFKRTVNEMLFTLGFFIVATGILASGGIFIVLAITGKAIYYSNLNVYWILLCATICNVLAMIPHYVLYAKRLDSLLLFSSILCIITAFVLNIFMIKYYGIIGAAVAMLLVYLVLGVSKLVLAIVVRSGVAEFSSDNFS